jgi:hypothetical protein
LNTTSENHLFKKNRQQAAPHFDEMRAPWPTVGKWIAMTALGRANTEWMHQLLLGYSFRQPKFVLYEPVTEIG